MDDRCVISPNCLKVPPGVQPLRIINVREHLQAPLDTPVIDSPATGRQFFCSEPFPALAPDAHLGVDMLYLPPYGSFPLHTHPGHHILFVVEGIGSVTFGGVVYATKPGDCYLIDGDVEHAVAAGANGHWLMSFGAPHKHLNDPDRMKVTVRPEVYCANEVGCAWTGLLADYWKHGHDVHGFHGSDFSSHAAARLPIDSGKTLGLRGAQVVGEQ